MKTIKKIAVVLPVLLVAFVYLFPIQFRYMRGTKMLLSGVAVGIFFLWVIVGALRRRQQSLFDVIVQSSFYLYIFSVLTLTGYFVFFHHVSAHGWWQRMVHRVATNDKVSLEPFLFLKARHVFTYDVVGNFMMLMPLGIYLPILYKRIRHFVAVTLVAMLVSVTIELMQLATNVRITDINDVILNTAGAAVGFMVYYIVYALFIKPSATPKYQMSASQ